LNSPPNPRNDFTGGSGKVFLRQHTPALYDVLVKLRRSRLVRLTEGLQSRRAVRRLIASGEIFDIDIGEVVGFGALLSIVVTLHHFFRDTPGLRKIVASNPLYLSAGSTDVLDQFFERKNSTALTKADAKILYRNDYDIAGGRLDAGLTVQKANALFRQNYAIKQEFLDQAESFFTGESEIPIGVHFRGSDKRFEAELVAWDNITRSVDFCLNRLDSKSIFVATDEPAFLEFMQGRYGSQRIRSLDCEYQAAGNLPAHFQSGDGFKKGQEALLTILLLSMCKICIRGASHLSAWAKILNPDLPVIMLGRPFKHIYGFPEKPIYDEFIQGPFAHLAARSGT
jgi:hypothetical protein